MEIKKGNYLKSKTGDWHQVLKVEKFKNGVHTQKAWTNHGQSFNEEKTKTIVYIFDGKFLRTHSIEEIEKIYVELHNPDYHGLVAQLRMLDERVSIICKHDKIFASLYFPYTIEQIIEVLTDKKTESSS